MEAKIFVDKQGVERSRVKTCKEHADNNKQVDFLRTNPVGKIAVVVLKASAIDTEIRFEKRIIIFDGAAKKLLGTTIHCGHIEAFVLDVADCILLFVGRK